MMAQKINRRLCSNCEGNVSTKDQNCPYCGIALIAPLSALVINQEELPPAPYKRVTSVPEPSIPLALYSQFENEVLPENKEENGVEIEEEKKMNGEFPLIALTITTLTLGGVFLVFSIILLLFANNQGVFTLHWSSQYWFIYFLMGLCFLYVGWKVTNYFNDTNKI